MHYICCKVYSFLQKLVHGCALVKFRHYEEIERYFIKRMLNRNHLARYIDKLRKEDIKEKSVLAIEINNFHGAVFANYIQFFIDLGYDTHILIPYCQNLTENPFQLIHDKYNVWAGTLNDIKNFLRSKEVKLFEVVYINTLWYQDYQNIFTTLGCVPKGRKGMIGLEHNVATNRKRFHQDFYFKNNYFGTPGGFEGTRMLCFPRIGIKQGIQGKSIDYCRFSVIGALSSKNRNFDMLFDAVEELIDKGYKRFEVKIIGPGVLDIPEKLQSYIKLTGWVDYKSLYRLASKTDFIVSIFDYYIPEHKKYLNNWFTGAAQLCYGFNKPFIMQREFAQTYFLNDENALLFEKQELGRAMESAIEMKQDDFIRMQNAVQRTAQEIEEISKNNLIEMLESQKCY